MKKSEISILLGLMLAVAVTFIADTDRQAAQIRHNTLRLHIIAQDDSTLNQHIKTQIQLAVEKLWPSMYCNAASYEQAVEITQSNLEYIKQVTDNALKNLDAGYTSQCNLEEFYFDTTTYGDLTLPRGKYTALTIKLGDATGKNWWCIVYPRIRCGIGGEYEADNNNTLFETDNFRIKLKIVEWRQDIKQYFASDPEYSNL
ncbi:MAG: stage II sporulation protein R [Oscillospiraceae bacterium]|nr:stage II sporulation protein R [Oscillospiraceae bacterium]